MKTKTSSLKRSIKLIFPVRITSKKGEGTQIINIRNERRNISTCPMDVKRIIKK